MRAVPTTWRDRARGNALFKLGMVLAAILVALDQVSKRIILSGIRLPDRIGGRIELSGIVDLTYVENTGVSFGLFAGGMTSRVLLSIVSVVVVGFVVHWMGSLQRRVAAIGGGLIVGGALGNLYDRVVYGYVVDFIDFSDIGFPFVFNVADAAINVGVACLAYDAFFVAPKQQAAPDAAQADAARADVTKAQDTAGFRETDSARKPGES